MGEPTTCARIDSTGPSIATADSALLLDGHGDGSKPIPQFLQGMNII